MSPAISAIAAVVKRVHATGLPRIASARVRPWEVAQVKEAQAVMVSIPVTKPMPNALKQPEALR
ncbi:hypothetical protein [Methylobacterium sp. CM6247]